MNFEQMLDDVYSQLGESQINKIILPNVEIKKDTTRIHWSNVYAFITILNAPPEHLFDYVKKNLHDDMNWNSLDPKDGLFIFNNRRKADEISNIIRKYAEEFSICKQCKNIKPTIYKDNTIRKWKVKCDSCKSEYTV